MFDSALNTPIKFQHMYNYDQAYDAYFHQK